jgi:hypothetical protein
MTIEELLNNPNAMEKARKAIEDTLVDLRDSRIGIIGRGNGLVIKEKDGTASSIIRLTTLDAIRIGLEAVNKEYK